MVPGKISLQFHQISRPPGTKEGVLSAPLHKSRGCLGKCALIGQILFLKGNNFPGHPVLPGVIIMEALAQTASFCALVGRDEPGVLGFFAGIDKAKFRHQVQPGDVLTLKADIVKNSSRMVVADVQALVGDQVAATATQKYVMAKGA